MPEIMAQYNVSTAFGLTSCAPIVIEVGGDEEWWNQLDELI